MNACHILLERPWEYDNNTIHRGSTNTYEFEWMGKKVVLLPIDSKSNSIKGAVKDKQNTNVFSVLTSLDSSKYFYVSLVCS